MKEELKNIKEMLFDAPIEVKKAFNQIVEYFSIDGKPYNGNLYRLYIVGKFNDQEIFVKANSRKDAVSIIKKKYPSLKFPEENVKLQKPYHESKELGKLKNPSYRPDLAINK